jgi:hypothetical protein
MLESPETTNNGGDQNFDESEQHFVRPAKKLPILDQRNELDEQTIGMLETGTHQNDKWSVNLKRWKSELQTPVASMIPFLRAQLKVLGVGMCIKHDSEIWSTMQYPQRAKRFLPIHGSLLRTLNDQWTKSPLKATSEIGELKKLAMDEEFFKQLDRFIADRANLLSLKSDHHSKVEPLNELLQSRAPHSIQKAGQSAGISAPILSSIVNIFMTHIQASTTASRSRGASFLKFLEMVGQELRKVIYDLNGLLRESRSSNNMLLQKVDSSNKIALNAAELQPEQAPILEPVATTSKFDQSEEFENMLEQRKLAILLLSKLHCSVAAVIL